MTIDDFQVLPPDLQYALVQETGVFLLAKTGVRATAKLYQLNNFYVEVIYKEQEAAVWRLTAHKDTCQFRGYLSQISLSELLPLLRC